MNKEFLSSYRTAILTALSVIITAVILFMAWKKENVEYLDRALYFYGAMAVFIMSRNLIRSIKIDNKQLGIQVDASEEKQEKTS